MPLILSTKKDVLMKLFQELTPENRKLLLDEAVFKASESSEGSARTQ